MDVTFSVVIPSRWNISNLNWILKSINSQTYKPQKVYIILDKHFSKDDFDVLTYFILKNIDEDFKNNINLISNINSEFQPQKWVSYARNFWISLVSTKYLYILDDDNVFDNNFFEKSFENRLDIKETFTKDFLISPTIMYRKSWKVQSQWMKAFNFWLSKVVLNKIERRSYSSVRMIGWNSLFWPTFIFQRVRFDERFEFVYEDLDFSYRVAKDYAIMVVKDLHINHMEREKNKLEKIFIWDEKWAYQKSRNRIWFARKNWTLKDKIKFFWLGLWIQTVWFLLQITLYSEDKNWLYKAVVKWTWDWIKE